MKTDTERSCARRDVGWLASLAGRGDWDMILRWAPAIADRYTRTEDGDTYHPLDAAWERPERAAARRRYTRQIADDIDALRGSQDPSHWRWSPEWDRIGEMCRRILAIDRVDRITSHV